MSYMSQVPWFEMFVVVVDAFSSSWIHSLEQQQQEGMTNHHQASPSRVESSSSAAATTTADGTPSDEELQQLMSDYQEEHVNTEDLEQKEQCNNVCRIILNIQKSRTLLQRANAFDPLITGHLCLTHRLIIARLTHNLRRSLEMIPLDSNDDGEEVNAQEAGVAMASTSTTHTPSGGNRSRTTNNRPKRRLPHTQVSSSSRKARRST